MTDDLRRKILYTIGSDYHEKKVIAYLRGEAKLSSRLIRTLKHFDDGIMLNGIHTRTIDILHEGDILSVTLPKTEFNIEPMPYNIEILFEDDDILVVNKPAMLPIHPSHNHQGDTLANAVVSHLIENGKAPSFRAIGRLDKGTSGIVVCALNSYCAARLQGNIEKIYYAVADGVYENSGTIDKPIYRPDAMKTLRAVGNNGDRAVTHWEAVRSNGKATLLKIHLETGRTHQIRVHFASLGTPLIGDRMYGKESDEICHQALHCGECSFVHPVTKEKIFLTAQMPEDMKKVSP